MRRDGNVARADVDCKALSLLIQHFPQDGAEGGNYPDKDVRQYACLSQVVEDSPDRGKRGEKPEPD